MNRAAMREYIYLDVPGIESLYAQSVETLEVSRTETTQKGVNARLSVGLKLRNLAMRMIGAEAEGSGELTGSKIHTDQITRTRAIEQKLAALLAFLESSPELHLWKDLAEATRQARSTGEPVFIEVNDTFNAPQFMGGGSGPNTDGYLLLEKGGASDYTDRDDYYKAPTLPVTMAASLTKMRGGAISATSHEAIFFRGYSGRNVPLKIFGTLFRTPNYFQVKPFAIWR